MKEMPDVRPGRVETVKGRSAKVLFGSIYNQIDIARLEVVSLYHRSLQKAIYFSAIFKILKNRRNFCPILLAFVLYDVVAVRPEFVKTI